MSYSVTVNIAGCVIEDVPNGYVYMPPVTSLEFSKECEQKLDVIFKWCNSNLNNNYNYTAYTALVDIAYFYFYFDNEECAILFCLKWGRWVLRRCNTNRITQSNIERMT